MRRIVQTLLCAGIVAASTVAGASAASAAGRHPFLSAADRGVAADVIRTHGDVRDLGRLGANKPVRIGLMMRYRHEAELEALTIEQGDKRSRYYHRYLSVEQWDNYFAPDPATYRRAMLSLERAGFRIEQTFRNRGMIRAVGSAHVAERYFHTQFRQVMQRGRGLRYVNATPAVLPIELRDSVIGVAGLHSVDNMHFPIRFASRNARLRHAAFIQRFAPMSRTSEPAPMTRVSAFPPHRSSVAAATPKPIVTSTPGPNPHPDPTESPGNPIEEFGPPNLYLGYGPPIFADAYDYPVQHGYGGTGHSAGSVIDSDFSDNDSAIQYTTFGIQRTGTTTRVCTDPNNICTICKDTATVVATPAGTCDPEGESTLDAQTIMSLAPQVNFYEYLVNSQDSLDDVDVDGAYERVVSDDVVDAVNSSFGECETDDPSALFDENYIAMEGAAEGIMFSASTGDTGATSCGLYAGNGTPQTEINVSEPAAAPYFTGVGGTSFEQLVSCTGVGSGCYTTEAGWMDGGGGVSVLEPQPSWQTALVAAGTTVPLPATQGVPIPPASSGRDLPDLSFTADPETGVPLAVTYQGTTEGIGGTSLSSPMWVAMQTEINQVQGSRNGFVNPRLYAIADAGTSTGTNGQAYTFAFRDVITGDNVPYPAGPGYDFTTGIGSVLGWELAGTE